MVKRGKKEVKKMDKIVAWIFIIIGILMLLPLIGVVEAGWEIGSWLVMLGFLIIGILKLTSK